MESQRGNSAQALEDLRKAIELNPNNLRATYQLAEETERQGAANSEAEFEQLVQKILKTQPNNLAALLELSRIAAKRGDAETVKSAVTRINAQASSWPPEVQHQMTLVQTAVSSGDLRSAATQTTFLRNVLMRVPDYRLSLRAIKAAPGDEAEPFTHFLLMEAPEFRPAPADTSLAFNPQPLTNPAGGNWSWIGAIPLGSTGVPVVAVANAREVNLSSGAKMPFPGNGAVALGPESVIPADLNYDFKTDLVLAGAAGVRLMRQENPTAFTDVTAQSKLPKSVTSAAYTGAWAVDIEADGDLDIVLGAKEGVPTVLRNNGDDTFVAIHPFGGISGAHGFAWADLDGDGNPDAAIIDGAGNLHVFMNERQGQFRERALPPNVSAVKAIAVADANNDGVIDLLAVQADGTILRISDKNGGESWETGEIAKVADAAHALAGEVRLIVADLDNNGALDLLLSPTVRTTGGSGGGALVWLGDDKGGFTLLNHPVGPTSVFAVADLRGNGHLDLLGLSDDEKPAQGINQTSKNYHWQVVRPHAVQAVGDQRINPFGVGGEIEVRSGLLVQKQPINGPQLHFGSGRANASRSGSRRVAERHSARRVWRESRHGRHYRAAPEGVMPVPVCLQRQTDGIRERCGSVGIGDRPAHQHIGSAKIAATGEWYKIGRDQLVPHDGYYDIRITAELWEVYYYDYMALMTVDHPVGTEIYVDERFVIPPTKLGLTVVGRRTISQELWMTLVHDVTDLRPRT